MSKMKTVRCLLFDEYEDLRIIDDEEFKAKDWRYVGTDFEESGMDIYEYNMEYVAYK